MSSPAYRVVLPRAVWNGMVAQAVAEMPNECVGVLGGTRDTDGTIRIVERYPLVNVAETPRVEYLSDAKGMFQAVREMDRQGLDLLGVYHSHPTSPPVPSKKDLARNFSEDVVNFIIGLTIEPPEVRGWWLTATEYREAEWQISEIG